MWRPVTASSGSTRPACRIGPPIPEIDGRGGECAVPRRGSLMIAGALVAVGATAVYVTSRVGPERVVIAADPGDLGENLGIGPSIPRLRARGWLNTDGFDAA